MSNITYDWFIRQPFPVEAVKITEDNLEDIAELIGEVRVKDGERYIAINRRVIPNISRAHVGYYMTRLGDNLRCYSAKIFKEQFVDMPTYQPVCFKFEYGVDRDPVVDIVQEGAFTGVSVTKNLPTGDFRDTLMTDDELTAAQWTT